MISPEQIFVQKLHVLFMILIVLGLWDPEIQVQSWEQESFVECAVAHLSNYINLEPQKKLSVLL